MHAFFAPAIRRGPQAASRPEPGGNRERSRGALQRFIRRFPTLLGFGKLGDAEADKGDDEPPQEHASTATQIEWREE